MKMRHKITGIFGAMVAAAAMTATPNSSANAAVAYQQIFTRTSSTNSLCVQTGPADDPTTFAARIQQWGCASSVGVQQQLWLVTAYAKVGLPAGPATVYQIKNFLSGMCLQVRSAAANAYVPADMDQETCGSGSVDSIDGQLWLVASVSGGGPNGTTGPYKLNPWSAVRRGSLMCADVKNASTSNGAFITQQFCNGTKAQLFAGSGLDTREIL